MNDFFLDLCLFLINCNIAWNKVNHPEFRKFFNKYICCNCGTRRLPEQSILRKVYLQKAYKSTITKIRNFFLDSILWLSMDETLDKMGNPIVNIVARSLDSYSRRPYLIMCRVVEQVNGETMANLVEQSLRFLWEDEYQNKINKFAVFCTDAAAYMVAAGKILKKTHINLKHVTCLAHAFHRIAEQIRSEHKLVDTLISNVKKIFLKSPKRIRLFKQMCPNVPLPPEPVITRWGTWLNAAFYYSTYFEDIKNVVTKLNSKDAISIKETKKAISNANLKNELDFIKTAYEIIPETITKLECTNISLNDSLQVFEEAYIVLQWCASVSVLDKLEKVLDRNPDFDNIRNLVTEHHDEEIPQFLENTTLTSVDVERSFSTHKRVFDNCRTRLTPENIEKIITIHSYYHFNDENELIFDEDYDTLIPTASTFSNM